MKGLYVVGARAKENAYYLPDESRYGAGCVLFIDRDWKVSCVKEYVSPPEACAENAGTVFKAATLRGDTMYACTETEVLVYQLPEFRMIRYHSLPLFNDVHHVRPYGDGNLLVVSTGLDMVVLIDEEGKVVREWDVFGETPWQRFNRTVDYRKVYTKPHKAHPNYVFCLGEEVWATRFHQRDAICLTEPDKRIDISGEKAHDGVVVGDSIYFTTVDGRIIIVDAVTLQTKQAFSLKELNRSDIPLGWARGIEILDDERVIVAFSRLRATKFIENVKWVQHQMGLREHWTSQPARLVQYNIRLGKMEWEFDLEPHGMNAVFSVHAV